MAWENSARSHFELEKTRENSARSHFELQRTREHVARPEPQANLDWPNCSGQLGSACSARLRSLGVLVLPHFSSARLDSVQLSLARLARLGPAELRSTQLSWVVLGSASLTNRCSRSHNAPSLKKRFEETFQINYSLSLTKAAIALNIFLLLLFGARSAFISPWQAVVLCSNMYMALILFIDRAWQNHTQ